MLAIIGVQAFAGAMSRCTDSSVSSFAACTGYFNTTGIACALQPTPDLETACLKSPVGLPFPRLWTPFPTEDGLPGDSFDDLPRSLLAIFSLLTGACASLAGLRLVCVDSRSQSCCRRKLADNHDHRDRRLWQRRR